jgi:hypothetical protein
LRDDLAANHIFPIVSPEALYHTLSLVTLGIGIGQKLTSQPVLTPRIFAISKMGEKVKQDVVPRSYTPRRLAIHPSGRVVYTIEADHRTLSADAKQKLLQDKVSRPVDIGFIDNFD